jgi:hypothetical protein
MAGDVGVEKKSYFVESYSSFSRKRSKKRSRFAEGNCMQLLRSKSVQDQAFLHLTPVLQAETLGDIYFDSTNSIGHLP